MLHNLYKSIGDGRFSVDEWYKIQIHIYSFSYNLASKACVSHEYSKYDKDFSLKMSKND